MSEDRPIKQRAFNPVSPIVVVLVFAMVVVELVFQAAEHGLIGGPQAHGWRVEMASLFGFYKAVFDHILIGGDIEPKVIWPFLTYLFISRSFMHMLIPATLILAMGKMIAEMFSGLAVFILFVACGLAGSLAFGMLASGDQAQLIGAFPVFYGFIGTFTWIRVYQLRSKGKSVLPAFGLIGMFIIMRGVFMAIYGIPKELVADIAGLIVGFLLAYLVAPDGKDRIKGWVRVIRER